MSRTMVRFTPCLRNESRASLEALPGMAYKEDPPGWRAGVLGGPNRHPCTEEPDRAVDLNRSQKVMLFKFSAYGFLKNLRFFEPFLLLFFTVEKGLSYTQFGALVAIREVAVYLLEIPTGIVADVSGRRRTMVMAFSSYLIAFAVFSLTSRFWAFVPAMILFGAGEALRSGTHKSMIMQHLDLEGLSDLKVHYYGTTRSWSRMGSAVSALLAGAVVFFARDYEVVFLASMGPYVLGLGLMFTYPSELDGKIEAHFSFRAAIRHTVESFHVIRDTRELLKVLLNASTAKAFFKVAKDYLQPILKQAAVTLAATSSLLAFAHTDTQRTAVVVAVVYTAIHLNEFYSSRASGRLADRLGEMGGALNALFWVFGAMFCLAGGFLWIGYGSEAVALRYIGLGLAVLMLFFFYTLSNLRMPIVTGYLSDRTDAQKRATVLSVLAQLTSVTAALVAPLLGLIADNLGIPYVFLIGGPVLLAAAWLLRLHDNSADGDASTEAVQKKGLAT